MKYVSYILFIISFAVPAQEIIVEERTLQDSINGTTILFVNGQENEKRDAENSRNKLGRLIKSNGLVNKIDFHEDLVVDNVFNRTFGVGDDDLPLPDYMESLVLLLLDANESITLNQAWSAVYQTVYNLITPENSTFISESGVIDILNDADAFTRLYNSTAEIGAELQAKIIDNLANDRHLIIVSHSQGNLFTNVNYQDLENRNVIVKDGKTINDFKRKIGNLQIATPAGEIDIMIGDYLTNDKDAILSVPFRLDPNFVLVTPPLPDPRGDGDAENNHSFETTYLSDLAEGNLRQLRNTLFQKLIDISSNLGEAIEDCNNDGVEDDIAFLTKDGGYISPESFVHPDYVIANNARVCGESFINSNFGNVAGNISGNVIFSDSVIGSRCSFVELRSDKSGENFTRVRESFICTNGLPPVANSSFVTFNTPMFEAFVDPIDGPNANYYFENSFINQAQFENAAMIAINSTFLDFSYMTGRAYIEGSVVQRTTYAAGQDLIFLSNGNELVSAAINSRAVNSTIEGLPLLLNATSTSTTLSSDSYVDRLATEGDYYVLLLNNTTAIESRLEGNADISGSVRNSFVRGFSGQTYRSFLSPRSSIFQASVIGRFFIDTPFGISNTEINQNFCLTEAGFQEFLIDGTCRDF